MKSEPAAALRQLAEPAENKLRNDGLLALYEDVELPLVTVLADLERTGDVYKRQHLYSRRLPHRTDRHHTEYDRRRSPAYGQDHAGGK